MKKLIRAFFKKIIGLLNEPKPDLVAQLNENGNLIHGENCKFESFSVTYTEPKIKDFCNIQIGKNCHLSCTIVLLNPKAKVTIGNDVYIGQSLLHCLEDITIDNNVLISWGATLIDNNTHSLKSFERKTDVIDWMKGPEYKNWSVVDRAPIKIESDCWIGLNSIIKKGINLGKGTIVSSGSVVTKSTDAYSLIGGNPAIFIKKTE